MTDLNDTPQVSAANEQPAFSEKKLRNEWASMFLRLFAGAVAGWSVWAFAASRMVRFTALEGSQTLTTGYVRYVLSPNNVALVLIIACTEMLFAKRRAVRILAIFVIPVASILLSLLGQTDPAWDPGAYIFLIVGLFAAVSVATTHKVTSARAYKLVVPVLAAALILITLAISPRVPQSAYTTASTQWDRDTVEYKCANPDLGYHYVRQDRAWSVMMVYSLCSDVVAYELSKAKDGCYSASETYAHLALVQGSHADNPSLAALKAQTYLTSAWLRGRDEMESGFCVRTKNNLRTFTRSDGSGLFSVGVTEWEDIRD